MRANRSTAAKSSPTLLGGLAAPTLDRVAHAVVGVVAEELQRDPVQRPLDGGDLGQHVDAVCLLADHPSKAAHLALDPRESAQDRLLVVDIPGAAPSPTAGSIYGEGVFRLPEALLASRGRMPSALAELRLHSSGKVREIYELEGDLLMVASDRISAYDVIMPNPIPDKGRVLTQMSLFWFESTGGICPNHFLSEEVPEEVAGRAIRVRRLDMYPVECVVRGYLSGSGWREYRESGSICGIELPAGLRESDRLPEPIFTPATKAEVGDHDENIDFERAAEIIGDRPLMEELRRVSIELYQHASAHAEARGIILADTKFEFGASPGAEVVLGDEVFTPDSSRFWPADEYEPGRPQRSFDKQYLRDWLDQTGWDHSPPAPELPEEVVANTRAEVPRGLRADHRPHPGLAPAPSHYSS